MDREILWKSIFAAANFLTSNQIIDRLDANSGRILENYNAVTGECTYSTNWTSGAAIMCLLAMFKRTGESFYLDRAEHAAHYILTLQVLDQRKERYYGAFREITPQSIEFCPRDATTAAWSLVWLYEATGNEEYLVAAVRFAEWHLKYGMIDNWPLWAVFMDDEHTQYYSKGSFQSGTGLFYHDLFMQTKDARYIEHGFRAIAENYVKYFFNGDGSIIVERSGFDYATLVRNNNGEVELDMHSFNDDFGNQMLLAAYDFFKDEKYLQKALKFAYWLAEHQEPDGNFSNTKQYITSAVPMALMYFDELGRLLNDNKLLESAEKTLKKLLLMQILESSDKRLYGAFEGMTNIAGGSPRKIIQLRTNAYALIALLKIEGKTRNFWLGGEHNCRFVDPIITYSQKPYDFKW